jgi:enoyl-CoA hydratase/carnithine racemase
VSEILYRVDAHVASITLNRPERRNAFTLPMVDAWADALGDAHRDEQVNAVVVTGAGGSFCSGVDLDELARDSARIPLDDKRMLTEHVHRVARTLEEMDKPVVAAVDGVAVGAGMDMALMCDYRIASPQARFSEGYVRLGLVPGDGGCWLLPRLVGTSRALRLLWTGEFVNAQEACTLGIVDEIADDPMLAATQFARAVAAQPSAAIRMIKRAVRQGARHDFLTALDLISSHFAVLAADR